MQFAAAGTTVTLSDGDAGNVTVRLHTPLPETLNIGGGQFLEVSGDCVASGDGIAGIQIHAGGRTVAAELSPIPGGMSFWQAVFLEPEWAGRSLTIRLSVSRAGTGKTELYAGEIACRGETRNPVPAPDGDNDKGEIVAICLASYDPDLEAFERQIDSIRKQTHRRWICIVNDDGTPAPKWDAMQGLCAGDGRFRFFQNPSNLGFYRNFEKALSRVPLAAKYVAFSDQDDYWYPNKLTRLIEAICADDALLAYSDMRIVREDGHEVAPTYWVNRRNEYLDLQVVMVANTVTGAASLFRSSLIDALLPFPPRVGDAFHDHWIACTAMSTGRLTYVDEPLYDYFQHGDSVIGHCDFTRFTITERVASVLRFLGRMLRPAVAVPLLKGKYGSALAVYRGECRRLRVLGETIRRRCDVTGRRRRQLNLCRGGAWSFIRLLALHGRVLLRGQTTDDAELRLAMGELARLVERYRLRRKHAVG